MSINIGTCGYGYYDAPENWKDRYESKLEAFSSEYDLLEVQKTFYKLPQTSTCERWRDQVPDQFEFTMKAWQALTHTIQSPTWRGNDDQLSEEQRDKFGHLRPNSEVVDAWDQTLHRARALECEVVVIQTPPSFGPSDDNFQNMNEFFEQITWEDLQVAWEPRGDWFDEPGLVESVCQENNLIHVTDLLRDNPLHVGDVAYVRLHGLNDDLHNYDYDYSHEELQRLADRLRSLNDRTEDVYCLFNNHSKFKNVMELKQILG